MYILAFLLALVTPLAMFFIGLRWLKKTPTHDDFLSYRSELAMQSEACWQFAHQYISKLWVRVGLITAIITVILMVVFAESYTKFLVWLPVGQMLFLCGTVFFVDSIMKAVFDEKGNRII